MRASAFQVGVLWFSTLLLLAGGQPATAQEAKVDLLPRSQANEPLDGQKGWTTRVLGSSSQGAVGDRWFAKVGSEGISFEADTALVGLIELKRPDLVACKVIRGNVVLSGREPALLLNNGTSASASRTSSGTFVLELRNEDYRLPLYLSLQIAGMGKIWGTVTSLVAEGCG